MTATLRNIIDNPILTRELRRRMRGKALIYSIITYTMLMTIATALVLLFYSPSPFAKTDVSMLQKLQATGIYLFRAITGIQILLVLIIAPTITAGVTTGEKERKTFDFLRVTTITRWMYVMGCFLSTAFYVGLALLCALPLLSLTFLYGGVSLQDVMQMFFYLLGASCVLSSFGLYISSVSERTRTAQGIIVFLIFAVLFGGFFLYNEFRRIFSGAAAATAAQGGSSGPAIYFLNFPVPEWMLWVGGLVLLSAVFLLLAARKLFEPEETRAFSHWQFALLFVALLGSGLAFLSANPFTNEIPELILLTVGYLLLLVGVSSFAVGRMEVGDEIWHLKRLVPALRPFDQTLPFLAGVALVWYYVLTNFPLVVKTLVLPPGLISSFLYVTLTSFAFLAFFARAATAYTGSRRRAGTLTMGLMAVIIAGIPLLVGIAAVILGEPKDLFRELYAFSPLALLIHGFNNPTEYAATTGYVPGTLVAIVYASLAAIIGVFGETKRFLKWRKFDYHYDMPGA